MDIAKCFVPQRNSQSSRLSNRFVFYKCTNSLILIHCFGRKKKKLFQGKCSTLGFDFSLMNSLSQPFLAGSGFLNNKLNLPFGSKHKRSKM